MINWSSNYYEGLDEFQHQANDVWFYRMRQLLKDDGVLYVPDLNKLSTNQEMKSNVFTNLFTPS